MASGIWFRLAVKRHAKTSTIPASGFRNCLEAPTAVCVSAASPLARKGVNHVILNLDGNLIIRVFYDFRERHGKKRHIVQSRLASIDFPALRASVFRLAHCSEVARTGMRNPFRSSFKAQRRHGTHASGAQGGYPDGQERDSREQDRRSDKGEGIQRLDSEEEAGEETGQPQ